MANKMAAKCTKYRVIGSLVLMLQVVVADCFAYSFSFMSIFHT